MKTVAKKALVSVLAILLWICWLPYALGLYLIKFVAYAVDRFPLVADIQAALSDDVTAKTGVDMTE